jgi:hypothetical protein
MFRPLKGHPHVLGIKNEPLMYNVKTALQKPVTTKNKSQITMLKMLKNKPQC